MIPIILISGGWGLFNQFIRPNHYQLLFPYSMFMFRDDNMTETKIGSDNKVEIKIPAGYALAGKDDKTEKLMFDEFWIDQTPVTVKEYKEFLKVFSQKYEKEKEDFSNILFDEGIEFRKKKFKLDSFIQKFTNKHFVEHLYRIKENALHKEQ